MSFQKLRRTYYTPNGWRLATFEEAENGLQTIKEMNLLERRERARLLDGWISGPDYDFEMGNDFRGCMGYMLVVKLREGDDKTYEMYDDVTLDKERKEVALLLCTEDWNYQVLYWVLKPYSRLKPMSQSDVSDGNFPLSEIDMGTFKTMKSIVTDLASELGKATPVPQNAADKEFSGLGSVRDVLGGMLRVVKEQDENMSKLFDNDQKFYIDELMSRLSSISMKRFEDVAAHWVDIAEAFWNFLSESFASFVVAGSALKGIAKIVQLNMKQLNMLQSEQQTITRSQENFIFATDVLFYTAVGLCEIIHAPLPNYTDSICPVKILYHASQKANGDPEHFKEMLRQNALWKCYDKTGNYDVLDKILVLVAKGQNFLERKRKSDIFLIKRLLESGANPGAKLPNHKNKTALQYAAKLKDETEGLEVAERLLLNCDADKREGFANSADAIGRTSLHRATKLGHINVCKLLLKHGARLDAQDQHGRTALHYAIADRENKVVDLFIQDPLIADCVDLKDTEKRSPLQLAIDDNENGNNIELVAKLLWKSHKVEAHFSEFNQGQLLACLSETDKGQFLSQSLVKGYVNIVKMLIEKGTKLRPGGDVDHDGKTVFHLATSCEDEKTAKYILEEILGRDKGKENWVASCDKRGRTVLHEAALKGHLSLCQEFLKKNPKLISTEDKDGRIPLYDAVQGTHDNTEMWEKLVEDYSNKGRSLDGVIDRKGQTPLHIAASKGKNKILEVILRSSQSKQEQMKRADFLGQTALHKAAKLGDKDTINILLQNGATPFLERDCDGRTALHYAVQAKAGREGKELADLLLSKCGSNEEKLLFLWASAAGLGTADQNLADSEVKDFLLIEKEKITKELKEDRRQVENLLQIAARKGNIEMTKELLTKGYQFTDIQSPEWNKTLKEDEKVKVEQVSKKIKSIVEQGNDQPTIADNLGRTDYAHGLAALLLNPFLKPPIAVGISGNWGMGKSSLMMQTEGILLKTVAELALPPDSELSGSTSNFPEVKNLELSKKGRKIKEKIKRLVESSKNNHVNGWFFAAMENMRTCVKILKRTPEKSDGKQGGPFLDFLKKYEPEYRDIYKSLAVMDKRDMFTISHEWHSRTDISLEGSVPSIITVQYNAWKYRNETEALAGMAVDITREMEGSMTEAQWLSTCWRNTWRKQKFNIWIEIIFPCLLAMFLACSLAWIVWLILDEYKIKKWAKTRFVCLPAAGMIIVWTLAKTVIGVVKPVSTQLMRYISFPDHTEKLGYQERVISDITFLKEEIGRTPCFTFTVLVVLWNFLVVLWNFIAAFTRTIVSLFSHSKHHEETIAIRKLGIPSNRNLRIIVFVDDLDRCQESVILQVLSAINLVLAVCEISVVLGMDKSLIERAIMKKYGDIKTKSLKASEELADKYLQKIIQLPLDLPEPSEEQSISFLKGQMGMSHKETKKDDSETETEKNIRRKRSKISRMFSSFKTSKSARRLGDSGTADIPDSRDEPLRNPDEIRVQIEQQQQQTRETNQPLHTRSDTSPNTDEAPLTGNVNSTNSSIPIRELLFIRYSDGEWDAICHFQKLATDCRKLPREWKRFLNYHRLVWNIFSVSPAAKDLAGWQVQLITWIFVCWEFKENMNVLIEKWNNVSALKTSESDGPSLRMIVEYLVDSEINKGKPGELGKDSEEQKIRMNKKTDDGTVQSGYPEESKQTKKPPEQEESSSGASKDPEADEEEGKKATGGSGKSDDDLKRQLHSVEKELGELKKEIKELKEHVMKQQAEKKAKREAETNIKLQKWERLKSALDRYDVSMEGILAFQRFRFYCIAGHLACPYCREENHSLSCPIRGKRSK